MLILHWMYTCAVPANSRPDANGGIIRFAYAFWRARKVANATVLRDPADALHNVNGRHCVQWSAWQCRRTVLRQRYTFHSIVHSLILSTRFSDYCTFIVFISRDHTFAVIRKGWPMATWIIVCLTSDGRRSPIAVVTGECHDRANCQGVIWRNTGVRRWNWRLTVILCCYVK